jgi:hypothetical protein
MNGLAKQLTGEELEPGPEVFDRVSQEASVVSEPTALGAPNSSN